MLSSLSAFCVSHHTGRIPDRTFQWERMYFVCIMWEVVGGCGKKKQLTQWHHVARKEIEAAGWLDVPALPAIVLCLHSSPPLCLWHEDTCVFRYTFTCVPVCLCDKRVVYAQMYVKIYVPVHVEVRGGCLFFFFFLRLGPFLSTTLLWEGFLTNVELGPNGGSPNDPPVYFHDNAGYKYVWPWCAGNLCRFYTYVASAYPQGNF